LIISNNKEKIKKTINLDISGMTRGLAFHIVTGKYIEGYDKIILTHNNFTLSQEIGQGFLGMVIEEHTDNQLIMKDIIKIPQDNFIEMFKRSCQLLISQTRLLLKLYEKEISHREIKNAERLLDNNLFYCLRYINKYEKIENSYKYFLLSTTIESVGDYISEISKNINYDKQTKETLEMVVNIIEKYVTFLFTKNISKMYISLKDYKNQIPKETFIDGLAFIIGENLYNYIGYLIENNNEL
ncbi:MAG: hypothetical protein KC550_07040, partial [Nanoarchaeota archaeon]|nr:hypothetical protein [Nanoarchaeota archaeon]